MSKDINDFLCLSGIDWNHEIASVELRHWFTWFTYIYIYT